MAEYDGYILCATPRSGSTMLCRMLTATGLAGRPRSLFHRPDIVDWETRLGVTPPPGLDETDRVRAVIARALADGRGDTGVFGLRLMRKSFDFLMGRLQMVYPGLPDDRTRFEAAFGKMLYIHLTREDKLAQAVSMVLAEQTGLWHRNADGTELERTAPAKPPVYDPIAIRAHLDALERDDQAWRSWFAAERLCPLYVRYDDICTDPGAVLSEMLSTLGRGAGPVSGIAPDLAPLSNAINRDWMARFRTESA